MRQLWCAMGLFVLLLGAAGARAEASASVDRSRIALSDTLELSIRVDSSVTAAEPELEPLATDFEVLGTRRSSRITIMGGRNESYTDWQITLLPKREGQLTIPALRVGPTRTQPLTITVAPDSGAGDASARDLRLEVETEPGEVHVQQQLLLTVRVLHAVNLNRGATLAEPEIADAVLRPLGENSFEKTIGGRRFGVFERRYAVFPQKSGELRIPALEFQASIGGGGNFFDQFGSRSRLVRLRSEERVVRVLGPEQGASPWLPARMLTVIETWDKSPQELRVGDSATRTITVTATGLTGAQLPPLALPEVPGLRFYPDQPRIEEQPGPDGITGTRAESSAVIPARAGEIEFPELRLRWWDTQRQRFEDALIPRRTIRVLPAANAAAQPPAPTPAQPVETAPPAATIGPASATGTPAPAPTPPWPWIAACAVLALSTLFSTLQWRRSVRGGRAVAAAPAQAAPDTAERALFQSLRAACRAADAARVQALLPAWGRAAFPQARIRSPSDIGALASDPLLAREIGLLLASRYGTAGSGSYDAAALLSRLEALRTEARRRPGAAGADTDALPPLYPAR